MWEGYEKRIELLKAGKRLRMQHAYYGIYLFYLNPQKNVLIAEPLDAMAKAFEAGTIQHVDGTTHKRPESVSVKPEAYVLWGYGKWDIEVEPPREVVTTIRNVPGVYEEIK